MVNWEDFTVGKTIATLFIWVLRVLLPMCLFWICFKFQQFQDGAISEYIFYFSFFTRQDSKYYFQIIFTFRHHFYP